MNKRALAERLGLDYDFAQKVEELPDFISLEGAFERLDPTLTEDVLYNEDVNDRYEVSHLGQWIVYGALVNKYGNDIPDFQDTDFSYFDHFDFEFVFLGELYDEVYANLDNAREY